MVMLTRSRVIGLVLALVAAGLVLAFWPREEPPVQEAITRKIVEMTRAAEEKDVSGVMAGVSDRFKSGQGWGKDQLKGVLVAQVLRGQWLRIFHSELEITEVSPTQGDFTVKFIFARSEAQNLEQLGQDSVLNAWAVEGTFEKEQDGEWRVVVAKNRRLDPSELF
jgi:ketosteroid isomerase-like protein